MRRHTSAVLTALAAVLALCGLAASAAVAVPAVNGEFQLTGEPKRIAQGPDGNMWVTISGSSTGNEVARISPTGVVDEFDVAELAGAIGIAAGPDGRMWVTQATEVASFDPANPSDVVDHAVDIAAPQTIATGPDGNLWTASADKVLRITPEGVATPFTVVTGARGIASSGGLLWVADFGGNRIVSVTTDGTPTSYATGGGPQEVAGGPNGQVAFSDPGTAPHTIGRLIAGGMPLTTETPVSDPFGVTLGADGAYWFAQFNSQDLGRLTPDGQYSRLAGFSVGGPRHIASGPGNTLWVTLEGLGVDKVARVTGVDPAPAAPPVAPAPPSGASNESPRIDRLRLSRAAFCVGRARTPVRSAAKKCKVGMRIRFRLSEAARVTVRIERRTQGHRRGVRWVKAGRLARAGKAGVNAIAFSGRVGRRPLAPGRYRLTVEAKDGGALTAVSKRARFRVLSGH